MTFILRTYDRTDSFVIVSRQKFDQHTCDSAYFFLFLISVLFEAAVTFF